MRGNDKGLLARRRKIFKIFHYFCNMDFRKPIIIDLPQFSDPRGSLTFVQDSDQIPFDIKRVYWIYDLPSGAGRGGHSHKELTELLIATSGSFDVNIFDGSNWERYQLNRPYKGLLIPPGYWRTLDNFASGSVCMVIASDFYNEEEYIRELDEFLISKNINS